MPHPTLPSQFSSIAPATRTAYPLVVAPGTFRFPADPYRGRLAPSPTGLLHVGHARTFFTAYQRARDAAGSLVLRIDDLDTERSRAEFIDAAVEDLRWLGIRWQEGPNRSEKSGVFSSLTSSLSLTSRGDFGPYLQSRRQPLYENAWRKLMRRGFLYPCTCSRKDLASIASAPHEGQRSPDDEPIYPGTCRKHGPFIPQLPGPNQLTASLGNVSWRFRVPERTVVEFNDLNLGPQRFVAGQDFGDFLVWRRDNTPSYQLACAVDDAAMAITEVVRGADLLKSTARQILILRALGLSIPAWFHCALVADHNGQRLAKRHDALSIRTLRQRGLTPMNLLAADLPTLPVLA